MFIPPRTKRGADETCTRPPRMLSAVTVGAVVLGATLGIVPLAGAEPAPSGGQPLVVDIVGDSYMAGDGMADDTYLDPADLRHRSLVSPALQALSRVASENPGLRVDANVVASSGAVTADYFDAQRGVDLHGENVVVNSAQHHQIRPNAQVVIVGFGGNDAELAQVLATAKPSNASTPGDLDAKVKNFGGLLDTGATDQAYLDQASATPLGEAPTLVSRMLQVLGGIANRAPNARIVVTNYPLAVDPEDPRSTALIKKRDLVTVQKFLLDLNESIERAVQICVCANLVDLTRALAGHEAYTDGSAYAEPAAGTPHTDAVRPNDEGAALMADPLAKDLASLLGIRPPEASRGRVTMPENIAARSGESDVDGDLVLDVRDGPPEDPRSHRRPDRHHHRDRSPERSHRSTDWDSARDTRFPDVRGVLEAGRKERDTRPGGNLPVQLLPPPAPAPKREAEPDELPADRSAADSETDERPRPRGEWFDADVFQWFGRWASTAEPEEVAEAAERWFGWRGEWDGNGDVPGSPADEDELAGEDEAAADEDSVVEDESAAEGESAGGDESVGGDGLGAEEVAPEDGPVAEDPAGEDESVVEEAVAEEDSAVGESVDEAANEVAEPVEAEENGSDLSDWTSEPVEEPVAEEPTEGEPVDEATDGQQVCILIYPAPAGCGEPS